jgi:hypothetical protein
MTNEYPNVTGMNDIDLVNHKYAHRAKGYLLNAQLKQNPGDPKLQQAVNDHDSHGQAIETQLAFRMARGNLNNPSTGI